MTEAPPHTSASAFALTLVLVMAFSVFLIFNEDPWALGRFVVVGIAYLAAFVLSIVCFASPRRRGHAMILLVATLVMLGGVYSLSGGNGYPATNVTNSTSYSCTTFSYTTNSSGYPARGSGFSCTGYNFPADAGRGRSPGGEDLQGDPADGAQPALREGWVIIARRCRDRQRLPCVARTLPTTHPSLLLSSASF